MKKVFDLVSSGRAARWLLSAGLVAVVAAGSSIVSEVVPDLAGDGIFSLLGFWTLVVLNGLIAGGAAIGLFDATRDTINGNNSS